MTIIFRDGPLPDNHPFKGVTIYFRGAPRNPAPEPAKQTPEPEKTIDTSFEKDFGATDLQGILQKLGQSNHACARLAQELGPIDGITGVAMIQAGKLTGEVGDRVHDFFLDEINNEAEVVWKGTLYDPGDEDNPDTNFPVEIHEYHGVFFVWAMEYDNAGYFLSQNDAMQYILGNWFYVREDE